MAYGKGDRVHQNSIDLGATTEEHSIIIPKICYGIEVRARSNSLRVFIKRDPNISETATYADEVENDADFITVTSDIPLILNNIRLLDKHVVWLKGNAANVDAEVLYVTGF